MKLFNRITEEDHRSGLFKLYLTQLTSEQSEFMKLVLIEAIRKLECDTIHPKKIEKWVVRLEKDYRNI